MQVTPWASPNLRFLNFTLILAKIITAVIIIEQSVVILLRVYDLFPYYDMVLVDYEYLVGKAQDLWLLPDNEHRPIFAMPLYWIDLAVFADQEVFLVLCNLVLAAYTVGNSLQTATARAARFGMQGALEYRHMIGEMPFWIGLVLLAVPLVAAGSQRRLFPAACTALGVEAGLLSG